MCKSGVSSQFSQNHWASSTHPMLDNSLLKAMYKDGGRLLVKSAKSSGLAREVRLKSYPGAWMLAPDRNIYKYILKYKAEKALPSKWWLGDAQRFS